MAIDGNAPPTDRPRVGQITIDLFLDEDGISLGWGYEGVELEAALGYLQVIQDRIRDLIRRDWVDICPGCGLPLEEHDFADHDEDDEDEEPA